MEEPICVEEPIGMEQPVCQEAPATWSEVISSVFLATSGGKDLPSARSFSLMAAACHGRRTGGHVICEDRAWIPVSGMGERSSCYSVHAVAYNRV